MGMTDQQLGFKLMKISEISLEVAEMILEKNFGEADLICDKIIKEYLELQIGIKSRKNHGITLV